MAGGDLVGGTRKGQSRLRFELPVFAGKRIENAVHFLFGVLS